MQTVTLEQSIVVKRDGVDTDVNTLTINTPTARHFVAYGSPFLWKSMDADDARARPVFNDKSVAKFLADLTGTSAEAIETMAAPDYLGARWSLLMEILDGGTDTDKDDTATIKLSKPITTHAGLLDTLKVSTPAAKLVIQTGVPFEWRNDENDNPFVVFNDRLCMKYLSAMTGRDELELEDLSAPDWIKARNKVLVAMNKFVGANKNPQ
jgi:hypothetical protein